MAFGRTPPPLDTKFEAALDAWLAKLTEVKHAYFRANYSNLPLPEFVVANREAPKYLKIIRYDYPDQKTQGRGGSVDFFIDRATGDVLKPAGSQAPAKGKRGSIYEPENPGYDARGAVHYLR